MSDVGNSMLALETELCYIVDDDFGDGDKDYGGEDDNVEQNDDDDDDGQTELCYIIKP